MRLFTMLALVSFLSTGIAAAGLRGDWQSAGAPMPPYNPSYKFLYRCQAELTDNEERVSQGGEIAAGRPFRLYAVQKFEISKGKTHADFEAGQWVWTAKLLDSSERHGNEQELKAEPKDAFSLKGHSAGISLARGSSSIEDRVTLSAYVKLPHGDYFLNGSDRETTTREASSVQVRAYAMLYREDGGNDRQPRSKERTLFVVCDKVK